MGQEINSTRFAAEDFRRFGAALRQETALARQMFAEAQGSVRLDVGKVASISGEDATLRLDAQRDPPAQR